MDQKIRFFTLLETQPTTQIRPKRSALSVLIADMIKDGPACFISHLAALFGQFKSNFRVVTFGRNKQSGGVRACG